MAKFYIKIASVILLFAGSVIAGYCIMPKSAFSWLKDAKPVKQDEPNPKEHFKDLSATSSQPIIENVEVSPSENNGHTKIGYRVTVTAKVESGDSLKYDITTNGGNQYTSTDGVFADVFPTDDGKFTVVVTNTHTSEQAQCEKSGLVNPKPNTISSQPMIESVEFPPFDYWNIPKNGHTKIGYKVTVKAKTESGDNLKYEIRTSSGKQYTSTNGEFADVYPTDDGKFTVVVTNIRTGEQAQCEKSGLVKNPKLTASQIEKQLTEGINNRMFYFYFATNLQFKCYGSAITEDNIPKNLNALIEIAGMGFTVDVKDSTIKYNEWNRITYFEIELN